MQALHVVKTQKSKVILIHEQAALLAKDLKSKYLDLFEILIEVERDKIYLEFEITSFYSYCTELLELSSQISKDFSVVVKKSLTVPELAKAIREKKITISKARKISSVVTETNAKEWIELAATCSTRIIEKAVAQANPREVISETLTYASAERLELKLGVSEEWARLLSGTKDLLSQIQQRAVTSEEALFAVMQEFNDRHHPVRKAERALARAKRKKVATISKLEPNRPLKRKSLKRIVVHAVNNRDQHQCTYISAAGRCRQKRWLDHHHIIPVADGGSDEVENLTTLCHAHHKIQHEGRL